MVREDAGRSKDPDVSRSRSHGVELRGGLRRLDLHLSHLELGALQPFAQGNRGGTRCGAQQTLMVHTVLDGLET